MSSETLPNFGLPQVAVASPNKYVPDYWVNKPHPDFGFLELQARDGVQRGWVQFTPPQGFLIFGRDMAAAHIFVGHPSVSNQHAVAAWDVRDGKCYIIDLESEHGTFVHDQVIEHSVPYELRPGARVRYGHSAHVYIFSNLPPELVDPNQEAPVSDKDRGIEPGSEASKPPFEEGERFDTRSEHRAEFDRQPPPQTPPFPGNGPPERNLRGPPPDHRGPPPDPRGPPPDPRGPPPDLRGPPSDRRGPPPDRWSPQQRRFDERRPGGPRGGPGPGSGRRMSPPRQGGRRSEGPGPGPGHGRGMSPDMFDNRRPDGLGPGPGRDRSPQRFDGRRPDGHGRGISPPMYNDRIRFDGPPRSPLPPRGRGRGRGPYRDGPISPPPRGRGAPDDRISPRGRGRTPPRRGDYR